MGIRSWKRRVEVRSVMTRISANSRAEDWLPRARVPLE